MRKFGLVLMLCLVLPIYDIEGLLFWYGVRDQEIIVLASKAPIFRFASGWQAMMNYHNLEEAMTCLRSPSTKIFKKQRNYI